MGLDLQTVKQVLWAIVGTREDELSCDECMEQLDRYVELDLAGRRAADRMPAVHRHLGICRDCREEYEGLVQAVRAIA